jgi:hypothetical protein
MGVAAFLNGHTHPGVYDTNHHKGFIELTGPALLDGDGIMLFTVDNGRLGYSKVVPGVDIAVVTSPGRDLFATRVFTESEFEIRVVSFSANATNFTVTGSVSGQLIFSRKTRMGADLYSMKCIVGRGNHSIKISGDLNTTVDFTIGVPIKSFDEFPTYDLLPWIFPLVYAISVCLLSLLLLAFWWMPRILCEWLEKVVMTMDGGGADVGIGIFLLPIGWPIFVGFLMRRIPPVGRVWALFVVICGLGLPYGFTDIEGSACLLTGFGYFVNGTFRYDVGSHIYGFFFAMGVAGGTAGLLSLFAFTWKWALLLDAAANLFFIVGSALYWQAFGQESVTRGTWLTISPGFIVIPIGTMIITAVLLFARTCGDETTPVWLVRRCRNYPVPAVEYQLLTEVGNSP